MPLYSSNIEEIKKLPIEDIIDQAAVLTFLLINEVEENGGKFITKPIRNLLYKDKLLEFGNDNYPVPDKPIIITVKEKPKS